MKMKNSRIFIVLVGFLLIGLSARSVQAETRLVWDPSPGVVDGYTIYYGTRPGNYTESKNVGNVTVCPITALKLEAGKHYFFVVRAYSKAGESRNSNVVAWPKTEHAVEFEKILQSAIPLPAKGRYGYVRPSNKPYINKVDFKFASKQNIKIRYEAFDVDYDDEVEILINQKRIGYAPKTLNNKWGKPITVTVAPTNLSQNDLNILTFSNTYFPEKKYKWGIRNIKIWK